MMAFEPDFYRLSFLRNTAFTQDFYRNADERVRLNSSSGIVTSLQY